MSKFIVAMAVLLAFLDNAYAGAPKVGQKAPDFSVVSTKGEKLFLSSLKGKVVLMGMFHICVPCMNQAMEFEQVRKKVSSDALVIIGINTHGDSKTDVLDYLSKFPEPVNFSYYLDPDMHVYKSYIQHDMPTVLVIDKEGVIRSRTSSIGADQLASLVKKLL